MAGCIEQIFERDRRVEMLIRLKKAVCNSTIGYKLWLEYDDVRNRFKNRKYSSIKRLRKYKDTKKGKRCFIVGNGPSLTINDLEKLKNEDSFAVNRIYKIFNQTEWRPTFYCSQDTGILDEIQEDLSIILSSCKGIFLNSYIIKDKGKSIAENNINYFCLNTRQFYPDMPKFSKDVSNCIYEGYTVAYACIQLAVYMGYSEIYIIGTDHNYNVNLKQDGKVEEKHESVNYMKGLEGKLCFYPQLEKSTLAFRKARLECEKRGIIIRNATRGGKLEEFERIDFDTLFK